MPNIDSISTILAVDSTLTSVSITPQPIVVRDTIYKIVEHTTNKSENAIQFVSHNTQDSIPTYLFLGLGLIAVILFISFKVLKEYIAPLIEAKFKIRKPYLTIYRFKTLIWFLYVVFAFYQLITSHLIIGLSTVGFIALLGINLWKDFFAGIYLKLDGRIFINDNITINGINGKISKLHIRNLELKSDSDETISIPYHHFLNATVAKRLDKGEERSRTITLAVKNNSDYNSIKAIEGILTICPWIYSHKQSLVKRNLSNETTTEYAISIYVSDTVTLKKVEEFLETSIKVVKHQLFD
jgi:hypothetical protein